MSDLPYDPEKVTLTYKGETYTPDDFKTMLKGVGSETALTLVGPMTQQQVYDALMGVDTSTVETGEDLSFRDRLEASIDRHVHKVNEAHQDAARYRWLRDNVFDVLCEGRPADCTAKWMLPRLVAEDITGKKFTFDEIIEIQMKRDQPNE